MAYRVTTIDDCEVFATNRPPRVVPAMWSRVRAVVASIARRAIHHLAHAGFAARIGTATAVALTATMCSYWTQSSVQPAAALTSAQLVQAAARQQTTDKADRLDAYAREARDELPYAPETADGSAPPWPLATRVTTGVRIGPNGERNYGIRIEVPVGTPVRAAADGLVVFAGNATDGYGKKVVIKHGAIQSVYGHASEILVKKNDRVRKGQVIAKSGQTGFTTSPRLYLGLLSAGSAVDPITFFSKAGTLNNCALGDPACRNQEVAQATAARTTGALAPPTTSRPVPPASIPLTKPPGVTENF
jgi:murein DD-endopeptidase MepM/ murein hydrolase activator NlpD